MHVNHAHKILIIAAALIVSLVPRPHPLMWVERLGTRLVDSKSDSWTIFVRRLFEGGIYLMVASISGNTVYACMVVFICLHLCIACVSLCVYS